MSLLRSRPNKRISFSGPRGPAAGVHSTRRSRAGQFAERPVERFIEPGSLAFAQQTYHVRLRLAPQRIGDRQKPPPRRREHNFAATTVVFVLKNAHKLTLDKRLEITGQRRWVRVQCLRQIADRKSLPRVEMRDNA